MAPPHWAISANVSKHNIHFIFKGQIFDELLTLDGEIIRLSRKVSNTMQLRSAVSPKCKTFTLQIRKLKIPHRNQELRELLSCFLSHLTAVRVHDKEFVPPFSCSMVSEKILP